MQTMFTENVFSLRKCYSLLSYVYTYVMSVKFYFIKKVTYTEWLFWNINGDSKTYKMVFGKVSCAATFMNTI